jgi:hypothetical protein
MFDLLDFSPRSGNCSSSSPRSDSPVWLPHVLVSTEQSRIDLANPPLARPLYQILKTQSRQMARLGALSQLVFSTWA